jgi:hypothetical protein
LKVAHVSFRDDVARNLFLRRLKRRMRADGHPPVFVSKWVRERFDPELDVIYVIGDEHADRCDTVALDISGVTCTIEEDA